MRLVAKGLTRMLSLYLMSTKFLVLMLTTQHMSDRTAAESH